jgi:hypothetical protein
MVEVKTLARSQAASLRMSAKLYSCLWQEKAVLRLLILLPNRAGNFSGTSHKPLPSSACAYT